MAQQCNWQPFLQPINTQITGYKVDQYIIVLNTSYMLTSIRLTTLCEELRKMERNPLTHLSQLFFDGYGWMYTYVPRLTHATSKKLLQASSCISAVLPYSVVYMDTKRAHNYVSITYIRC